MVRRKLAVKKWRRRMWWGAGICAAAALGPLVYCRLVEAVPEALQGLCVQSQETALPGVFLLGTAVLILGALGLTARERQLEKEERLLDLRVQRVAGRDGQRTPILDKGALREERRSVPEVIEVEESLELGALVAASEDEYGDRESVMVFLDEEQTRKRKRQETEPTRRPEEEGLYYPPGLQSAQVLYVDGEVELTPVEDEGRRVNNADLPYVSLDEAVRHAFRLVMEHHEPVLVRVMPGVYQTTLELPDRVTVLNHRLPQDATVEQRLAWLREQVEIDHPDRVTILTPGEEAVAVRVMPGQKQGLFGCYVVGRKGAAQTGVKARSTVALAMVHCAFEGFGKGGVVVEESGEELPGRQVQFVGCLWRGNSHEKRGGALRVRGSVVSVDACVFESNKAPQGGAIAVVDTEKPFLMERCLLQRNRALSTGRAPSVADLELGQWRGAQGLGGALFVRSGLARVVDCIFDGNDAAVGGGAVAALGARVVMKATEEHRGIINQNRAAAGGGVLAVGWAAEAAMIRLKSMEVTANLGSMLGGGAACVGRGLLHFEGGVVERNRAAGKDRGFGGGVAVWRGGTVQAKDLQVASNQAMGSGGGIAVINGHLSMVECSVNRNQASDEGGGLLVVTAEDAELERLMSHPGFELPFKLKLDGVRVSHNGCKGLGGGMYAGNLREAATFPLTVLVRRPDWMVENEGEGRAKNLAIRWAESREADDETRGRVKLALQ